VVLNELLAANDSTLMDEAGEYDDWFELHNPTDQAVDLAGMFLSDDLGDPQKWEIPAGTVIEPGGFLLLWADEDADQGPLHTSFKLNADGEELGLFDTLANGNGVIDSVSFPAQESDVSYGRVPDGNGGWSFMNAPTPGSSNGSGLRRARGRLSGY
jgi:hypothetical protein